MTQAEPENGNCPDGGPQQPCLSVDAILELLANHRRRDLLDFFQNSSTQAAPLQEVTEHLTACELDRVGEHPGFDQLRTELFHTHIPKLADTGLLEYDERSEQLRYWPNERVEKWLNHIHAMESE